MPEPTAEQIEAWLRSRAKAYAEMEDDWQRASDTANDLADAVAEALSALPTPPVDEELTGLVEAIEERLVSIEQWASLMRRRQLTQPMAAGRSIGSSVSRLRKAIASLNQRIQQLEWQLYGGRKGDSAG